MSDLSRRQALKLAGAAVAGAGATAVMVPAATAAQNQEASASSGEMALEPTTTSQVIKVTADAVTAAGGLNKAFLRISPDASPGNNTLTISGLPAGTRVVSAWMTEWATGNKPHAGGAFFSTASVQLYDDGRKCRVRFHLQWNSHLPAAVQLIYG
ncbi:twin-arginine translocation signal domain-containing protein [Blastopirellula marina]|nr:twin-arginine translocation signal domain-containing protein [Blastopirellula marina]